MKELAMRNLLGCLMLGTLLVAGYDAEAAGGAPSASALERPFVPNTVLPNPTSGAASSFSSVSPLPSRPPLFQMAPPSVSEGQIGAAPNRGPITGYGPGGMARLPGSPRNQPY